MECIMVVYGAYGHTEKFVVDELCRNNFKPILAGRDEAKLSLIGKKYPDLLTYQ